MKRGTQFFTILLTLSLGILLCSCGKTEAESTVGSSVAETSWGTSMAEPAASPSEIPDAPSADSGAASADIDVTIATQETGSIGRRFPTQFSFLECNQIWVRGNGVFLFGDAASEENGSAQQTLYRLTPEDDLVTALSLSNEAADSGSHVQALAIAPDGESYWAIVSENTAPAYEAAIEAETPPAQFSEDGPPPADLDGMMHPEQNLLPNSYRLIHCDLSGQQLDTHIAISGDLPDFFPRSILIDAVGTLYVYDDSGILCYDETGTQTATINAGEQRIDTLMTDAQGSVYVRFFSSEAQSGSLSTLEDGRITPASIIGIDVKNLFPEAPGTLLSATQTGLSRLSLSDGNSTELFSWANCGIASDAVVSVATAEDGSFYILLRDSEETNSYSLYMLQKEPA